MNDTSKQRSSLTMIHSAVILFGMAGLFGKWITLPPELITLGRTAFAGLSLYFLIMLSGYGFKLSSPEDKLGILFSGLILAIHWYAFFVAVKISTVAIALITFASFPVFVTLAEPLFFKEKYKSSSLLIAFISMLGVMLVIPEWNLSNNITSGALWGTLSGLLFAALSLLNRKYVSRYPGTVIAFYQNVVATLVLLPFLFFTKYSITVPDVMLLLLLGIVFTAGAHTLFIMGLKHIKAGTASIIACLEPVYGTAAAIILTDEIPSLRTVIGGIIVLTSAIWVSYRSY